MEKFIGRDTASVELFSTYSPSELKHLSFRGTTLVSCVLEACRLRLESLWHSFPSVILKTLTGQEFLEVYEKMEITGREIRDMGRMMIKHLPAELLQKMWWPSSRVAIDLAYLTINLDLRYALFIQKLYHKQHFTDGWCCIWASIFNRCNVATVRTGKSR